MNRQQIIDIQHRLPFQKPLFIIKDELHEEDEDNNLEQKGNDLF